MVALRQVNNIHLCFNGSDAPCATACPFNLDMRAFQKQMQRGRFDGALRIYRNAVVFPDIVWRLCPAVCKEACIRGSADAPIG